MRQVVVNFRVVYLDAVTFVVEIALVVGQWFGKKERNVL